MRRLSVIFFAAAALAASAAPALASAHVPFQVIVNGGAAVTRHPLAVHQVITCGGVAHTVTSVHGAEVTLVPRLTAPAVCST